MACWLFDLLSCLVETQRPDKQKYLLGHLQLEHFRIWLLSQNVPANSYMSSANSYMHF